MFFVATKSRICSRLERLMVAPRGFEGLVMSNPLTLRFLDSASSYAASRDSGVISKLLELLQWTGTISTPVRHLKSLSNL